MIPMESIELSLAGVVAAMRGLSAKALPSLYRIVVEQICLITPYLGRKHKMVVEEL